MRRRLQRTSDLLRIDQDACKETGYASPWVKGMKGAIRRNINSGVAYKGYSHSLSIFHSPPLSPTVSHSLTTSTLISYLSNHHVQRIMVSAKLY